MAEIWILETVTKAKDTPYDLERDFFHVIRGENGMPYTSAEKARRALSATDYRKFIGEYSYHNGNVTLLQYAETLLVETVFMVYRLATRVIDAPDY